jgi:hypothetical protein
VPPPKPPKFEDGEVHRSDDSFHPYAEAKHTNTTSPPVLAKISGHGFEDYKSPTKPVTVASLSLVLGKSIADICENGYTASHDNHCAHFVSHMCGFGFGLTCKTMSAAAKQPGANIRVQQLFARCPSVGRWDDHPKELISGLVFVTAKQYVDLEKHIMTNVPKKHVGIFFGDRIWHYSNSQHKVVTQSPEDFVHHYPGPDIALFYGSFPT